MNIKDFFIKNLKWFILGIIIILVTTFIIINKINNHVTLNDSYVNGNYGGNLYNGGYFCEHNGTLFFANPDDKMSLYSASRNFDDLKKISGYSVAYINADDNYVYFSKQDRKGNGAFSFLQVDRCALYRVKHNGKKETAIDHDPCMYSCLVGNYIYYIHYDEDNASTLYKIKINGKEREMVMKEPVIAVYANERYIYYTGVEKDHHLYKLDTESKSKMIVSTREFYNPIIIDNYVYYMDPENDYHITSLNLSTDEKFDITHSRADCFNMYGNFIFYQKNKEGEEGLYRIRLDGTNEELIASGVYCNINVTTFNVYFSLYDVDDSFYMIPTSGKIVMTKFSPGVEKQN